MDFIPEQRELRRELPVVVGNVDYREFEERLERMDELLRDSGLERKFVEQRLAAWVRGAAGRVWVRDELETGRIREMDAVPMQPVPTVAVCERDLVTEVETGYDRDLSGEETQRCYRCNFKYEIDSDKCIYCDWCIKAKPRPECILRVRKLHYDEDGRIVGWEEAEGTDDTLLVWINQYDCIRCGACVQACPVDAISVQKADLETVPACERCESKREGQPHG